VPAGSLRYCLATFHGAFSGRADLPDEGIGRLRARGGKLGEATLEELDAIWEEIKKDSRS